MSQPSPARAALKSMTGYAQARLEQDGWTLRLSLRSVNHRFLDLHVRLPEGFEQLEPRLRQLVRERIRRGHVDLTLHFDPASGAGVEVNRDVAASYVEAVESLRRQFGVKAEPDLANILRLPGVIAAPSFSAEANLERLTELVTRCLSEALERLDQMRFLEGRLLVEELVTRLRSIAEQTAQIETLTLRARPLYAQRLAARLKDLLKDAQLDPARLALEAALAAERNDTTEELARLRSHVRQFEQMLSGAAEAGKKLDFLLQEMQREANTLLSKAPGNEAEGLEITRLALDVKSEIEKLREQVQNIE
jgi:uncharacterized protein (TIGR00255 family)